MDNYIIIDVTPERIKILRDHLIVDSNKMSFHDAIQCAVDDSIEKFIAKPMHGDICVHSTMIRRGMKVRPTKLGFAWQVDFRSGDQYRLLRTNEVPKEELYYE